MTIKSFKDIYTEDSSKPEPVRQDAIEVTELPNRLTEVNMAEEPKVVSEAFSKEDGETIIEAVREQREETERVVETLVKSNKKISSTVVKLVESANETNTKLLEAISALTEKVSLLENRIEGMKDLEIPTPIVNVQMPGKRTTKKVYRDAKGMISHIEESEDFGDDEDDQFDK